MLIIAIGGSCALKGCHLIMWPISKCTIQCYPYSCHNWLWARLLCLYRKIFPSLQTLELKLDTLEGTLPVDNDIQVLIKYVCLKRFIITLWIKFIHFVYIHICSIRHTHTCTSWLKQYIPVQPMYQSQQTLIRSWDEFSSKHQQEKKSNLLNVWALAQPVTC